MKKHFLYSQVDLPNLPDWFLIPDVTKWIKLDDCQLRELTIKEGFTMPLNTGKQQHDKEDNDIYSNRVLHVNNQNYSSSFYFSKFLDGDMLEWAKNNISQYVQDIRFSFTPPGRNSLGPHSDCSRSYTMMYLLKTGGDCHETVFYKSKKNNELIRPLGDYVNDYDELERIGQIRIPLQTWTILNARIFHSVENIKESRIALQVSFADYPKDLQLINPVYYDYES